MKKVSSLIIILFVIASVGSAIVVNFNDLSQSHWAYNTIIAMKQQGLVNGYPDGSFKPEGVVTREEFVQMIFNVKDLKNVYLKISDAEKYFDVEQNRWSYDAIQLFGGYIKDSEDGYVYFYPQKSITREEVAKLISDAFVLNYAKGTNSKDLLFQDMSVMDVEQIDSKYTDAVYNVYKSGYMNGMSATEFSPKSILTRAQAATLLYRMVNGTRVVTSTYAPTPVPTSEIQPTVTKKAPEGGVDIIVEGLPKEIRYNDSFIVRTVGSIPEQTSTSISASNGIDSVSLGIPGVPGTVDQYVVTGKMIADAFLGKDLRHNSDLTITIFTLRSTAKDGHYSEIRNSLEVKTKYVFTDDNIPNTDVVARLDLPSSLKAGDTWSISINRLLREDEDMELMINNHWVEIMYKDSPIRPQTMSWTFIGVDKDGNELDWRSKQKYEFSGAEIIKAYSSSIASCPDVDITVKPRNGSPVGGKTTMVIEQKQISNDNIPKLLQEFKTLNWVYEIQSPNARYIYATYDGEELVLYPEGDKEEKLTYKKGLPRAITFDVLEKWCGYAGLALSRNDTKTQAIISRVINEYRYADTLDINNNMVNCDRLINILAFLYTNDLKIHIVKTEIEVLPEIKSGTDFDTDFIRLENKAKNVIYSPLSIKYALKMLSEGAGGNTKTQIDNVVGKYNLTKYASSKNLSLANGLFIREDYANIIKQNYVDTLKSKYDAEVILDKFQSANNINKWISTKTFEFIPKMLNDGTVVASKTILVNALAIDMEWSRKLETQNRVLTYYYEDGKTAEHKFLTDAIKVYPDKSRNTVTDSECYDDEGVQVFVKKLKDYNGTQLEFMAIMPKEEKLSNYAKNITADIINKLRAKTRPLIEEAYHADGIAQVLIDIPKFNFDYDLNLKEDLNALGIKDAFDTKKADLSGIADDFYVSEALHKAKIEFGEDGIKAAAVTVIAMRDSMMIEPEITYSHSMIFNHPFFFVIRDCKTGEIWFVGTVYEPDFS